MEHWPTELASTCGAGVSGVSSGGGTDSGTLPPFKNTGSITSGGNGIGGIITENGGNIKCCCAIYEGNCTKENIIRRSRIQTRIFAGT
jgi:hypothetical protein